MSADENFLSRWSKRKQEAQRDSDEPPQPEAPAGANEEPVVDLASLPSLDDLTQGTDIRAFLQKGVPESLRNAALRKAWALDPAIRNYVGEALDYAYDWNTPGGVPGNGDLPAGLDVAALVERIFGQSDHPSTAEKSANEEIVAGAAAQQNAPTDPHGGMSPHDAKPASANLQDPGIVPKAEFTADAVDAEKGPDAVLQKTAPRRHGGALPKS